MMADPNPSSPDSPRPPSSGWSMSPATTPKLRDSCHHCAKSKIRCSKEKPSCTRCATRGKSCQYFATRRTGRKRKARLENNGSTKVSTPIPTLHPGVACSTSPSAKIVTSTGDAQPATANTQCASSSPDDLAGLGLSTGLSSALTPVTYSSNFDNLFAPPTCISLLDITDSEDQFENPIDHQGLHGLAISTLIPPDLHVRCISPAYFDEGLLDFSSLFKSPADEISQTSISPTDGSPSSQGSSPRTSSSGCSARALDILNQLFLHIPTSCPNADNPTGSEKTRSGLHEARNVVKDNEETLEELNTILQCPCSQDGLLLSVMFLAVLKVLDSYRAATREIATPGNDRIKGDPSKARWDRAHPLKPPYISGKCGEYGYDQDRMTAQLVLGELHRVQRIINGLSKEIKGQGRRDSGCVDASSVSAVDDVAVTVSSALLDQLETEVRGRLRVLAANIMKTLRED